MSYETIIFERKGPIATITFNRPPRLNAISIKVVEEVADAIEKVRVDNELRVLVLKGAGRAFCAGDDLSEPLEAIGTWDAQSMLKKDHLRIVTDLMWLRKPVIAALHGYVLGGGFDVALACDFRIAAEGTKLSPFVVRRGLGGAGNYLLPRYVGLGKATELLLTGDFIEAKEAERLGLVTKVVPPEKLESATQEMAERFAKGPTRSYGLIKVARNQGLGADPLKGIEYQAYHSLELILYEDSKEGPRAFIEKREPQYKGK